MHKSLDAMARNPTDLVYPFHPAGYFFSRYIPFQAGESLESFENAVQEPEKVWEANTETHLTINHNALYISEGAQSLRMEVIATRAGSPHYGGVKLSPPATEKFLLDLWVVEPKVLRALHVWEVDNQGNPVYGWANTEPSVTLVGGRRYRVALQKETDGTAALAWIASLRRRGPVRAIYLIIEPKDGGHAVVYLDRVRERKGPA